VSAPSTANIATSRAPQKTSAVTVGALSRVEVTRRLRAAGCVAAEDEADELLACVGDGQELGEWLSRREQGEPLAWITGRTEFCNRFLSIECGVYVPRRQTEELVRQAAGLLGTGRAADLCTGSGAVALALIAEAPDASVVAVDIDEQAVKCARSNGVCVIRGHLADPLRSRSVDVVTAVAPYVPSGSLRLLPRDATEYEPGAALDGGEDGLVLVREIVGGAARILRSGGWLLLEVGGDQDRLLASPLAAAGFGAIRTWSDDEGDLRGLATQFRGPFK
jgi:release factor glutamine methyltransferase